MYQFVYGLNADGTPNMVPGQHNIIDVLPGSPGYSDLWQTNLVTVAEDYEPDSIRSVDGIVEADLPVTSTTTLVNRPVVAADSTVAGAEPTQAWFQEEKVFYVDFGENPDTANRVFILITGQDDLGNPIPVPGQQNIFESIPGLPDYSAFCRINMVTVPEGYTPNAFKSASDVLSSGYEITVTDTIADYPIISPVATATAEATSTATPSESPSTTPTASPGG